MKLGAHSPQSSSLPQPSPTWPHWAPAVSHVCGVQPPHLYGSKTPQSWPAGQVPQLTLPPQPLPITPHSALLGQA